MPISGIEQGLPISRFADVPPGGSDGVLPSTHESAEQPFAGQVVLITGGSRDIGAGIVRNLAERGATVVAGYNNKGRRADAVAKDIAEFGNPFEFVSGDITKPEGITALTDAVDRLAPQKEGEEGQIDLLILNAASSTRELNVEGNNALIDAALPRMKKGGKIVYMQSGPGHFNSILAPVGLVPDVYTGVASTKDEAERSIAARLDEMQAKGISLVRIVAPAIPDSSNVRMFKSRDAEAAAKFDEISQKLGIPETMSVDEVSKFVVDVLERDTGSNHLELFGPYADGRHVLSGIYGESAIYPDVVNTEEGVGRMIVTPNRAGRKNELVLEENLAADDMGAAAELDILPEHAEGHFTEESGLPLVFPGHKHIRAAVSTLHAYVNHVTGEDTHVRLRGFDEVAFKGAIKPGDKVIIDTTATRKEGDFFQADAKLLVNDEVRTEITGLIVEKIEEPSEDLLFEDQMIEFAAQSAAVEIFAQQPDKRPLFGGIGRTRFTGMEIKAGDSLTAMVQDVYYDGKRKFAGSSVIINQDGTLVGEVADMKATIASQALLKRALGVTS